MALGIGLLQGPTGGLLLMSLVPLYGGIASILKVLKVVQLRMRPVLAIATPYNATSLIKNDNPPRTDIVNLPSPKI